MSQGGQLLTPKYDTGTGACWVGDPDDNINLVVAETNAVTGGIRIEKGAITMQSAPVGAEPTQVVTPIAYAGDGSALVAWNPVDATSSYEVKANGVVVATVPAGESGATVSGLTNGVTHVFTVTAKNQTGYGPESNQSNSVTPKAAPVAGLPPSALWLDASQLALSNGANVTVWADQSGSGRDAVNSGAGLATYAAPTFVTSWANSKPAVQFSGNNQALTIQRLVGALKSKSTVFIVLDCSSLTNSGSQTNQQIISNQRYVASPKWDDQTGLAISTAGGAFSVDCAGGLRSSSAAITLNTPTLLSANLPGNYFVNGTKRANSVSGLIPTNANNFALGASPNSGTLAFTGRIAEVIIYPVALTQSQRWAVESALATKYGLTVAQQ